MGPGWLAGLAARGLVAVLSSCWSPDRAAAAVGGPIADVGVLAAALVSALTVERTLLVDAAAPFGFVLSDVVPLFCVDSCPVKRVGNSVSEARGLPRGRDSTEPLAVGTTLTM